MTALVLNTHRVEKPWGRHDLAPLFADAPPSAPAIGEIWFDDPANKPRELLVKYLFTSQRLSVQVHPDDAAAQARGYPRGKDEAWVILSAEPGSSIALGLKQVMDPATVRAGALDGSIEDMLDWKPVRAGDVIYSPAGTIHAIGAGLHLVEIQQNLDLTYRFYDYRSARELHLDDAMAVSDFGPFKPVSSPRTIAPGRELLAEGAAFVLERWTMTGDCTLAPGSATLWVLPIEGDIRIDGQLVGLGTVVVVEGAARASLAPGSLLYVAYPGARSIGGLAECVGDPLTSAYGTPVSG